MEKETEKCVREAAKKYIGRVFSIPLEHLDDNHTFGFQIKAKPNSSGEDEYDDLTFDIKRIVDDETMEDIFSNKIPINTLRDFCDLMIKFYDIDRRQVRIVLGIGKRRKFLFLLRKTLKRGKYRNIFYKIKKRFFRVGD